MRTCHRRPTTIHITRFGDRNYKLKINFLYNVMTMRTSEIKTVVPNWHGPLAARPESDATTFF